MKIKLYPRFYVIVASMLIVGGVASSLYLFQKTEVRQSGVLAQATENDPFALKESLGSQDISVDPSLNARQSAEGFTPVTLSHIVKEGDTLSTIADEYHADPQTIADYPYNEFEQDFGLIVGQTIIIPNGYIEGEPPPLPVVPIGTGQLIWPIQSRITQYSSWFHPGSLDLAAAIGTRVLAADDGTVIDVKHLATGYGEHVIIDHGAGLTSLYGHLSQIQVQKGQGIRRGDTLGLSGSTGRSTGPHLHFEVRKNGEAVDPLTLLPAK